MQSTVLKKYNIKNKEEQTMFASLYKSYVFELGLYSDGFAAQSIINKELRDIRRNTCLERYFVVDQTNIPIGFLLIGFDENTQPDTDWFISDLYIRPDFRKQGFGKKAFEEFCVSHKGIYCFFIPNRNNKVFLFLEFLKKTYKLNDISNHFPQSYCTEDHTFFAVKNN